MKKPKRKVVTTEIETSVSNKYLKGFVMERLTVEGIEVIQVQVNEIKKEK